MGVFKLRAIDHFYENLKVALCPDETEITDTLPENCTVDNFTTLLMDSLVNEYLWTNYLSGGQKVCTFGTKMTKYKEEFYNRVDFRNNLNGMNNENLREKAKNLSNPFRFF